MELEKLSTNGTRIWVGIAITVLLASFVPLLLPGIAVATRIVLGLLHLVVGVMLIPGINHTSPHHPNASRSAAAQTPLDQPN